MSHITPYQSSFVMPPPLPPRRVHAKSYTESKLPQEILHKATLLLISTNDINTIYSIYRVNKDFKYLVISKLNINFEKILNSMCWRTDSHESLTIDKNSYVYFLLWANKITTTPTYSGFINLTNNSRQTLNNCDHFLYNEDIPSNTINEVKSLCKYMTQYSQEEKTPIDRAKTSYSLIKKEYSTVKKGLSTYRIDKIKHLVRYTYDPTAYLGLYSTTEIEFLEPPFPQLYLVTQVDQVSPPGALLLQE